MREFKFRAWNEKKRKMYFVTLEELCTEVGFDYGIKEDVSMFSCQKEKNIIMQFIGLKDKNGKELYEGDIYDYEGYLEVLQSIDDLYFNELKEDRMNNGKIVGNIYEDKELLKKVEEDRYRTDYLYRKDL